MAAEDSVQPLPPLIPPPKPSLLDETETMKSLTTPAVVLALLLFADASVGHCGGPFSRLLGCKTKTSCAPARKCCPTGSASDMGTRDNPSELNIMLTTELVALRERVADMTAAVEEKDKALAESEQLIAKLKGQVKQLQNRVARQTKRSKQAEEKLAATETNLAATKKAATDAKARAEQQINQLTKQNKSLQKKVQDSAAALQVATESLEQERKEREEERRKNEENAAQTPPANVKEDDAAESTEDDAPAE